MRAIFIILTSKCFNLNIVWIHLPFSFFYKTIISLYLLLIYLFFFANKTELLKKKFFTKVTLAKNAHFSGESTLFIMKLFTLFICCRALPANLTLFNIRSVVWLKLLSVCVWVSLHNYLRLKVITSVCAWEILFSLRVLIFCRK